MTDPWAPLVGEARAQPLTGEIVRLVESQEQVATNRLVATLAEQDLLESMLEASKPPLPKGALRLDYLLAAPFRYPPLPHGSRFGGRHEPGLFYSSRTVTTVLAESAYYRFVFWHGMRLAPRTPLRTQHTLFGAKLRARRAYVLHATPFDVHRPVLASREDYGPTQALGRSLRAAGADALEYVSARDAAGGLNVALFSPAAFGQPRPTFKQEWLCDTRASEVSYYARGVDGPRNFALEQFTVNRRLPAPAA
jgi:hypothetical protein